MKRNFSDCVPCRGFKAKFYNILVNFYVSMMNAKESNAIVFNASQSANADMIQSFLDGHCIYPTIDPSAFVALKANEIAKNRPIRKDKVAIYNALVLFMESSLNNTDHVEKIVSAIIPLDDLVVISPMFTDNVNTAVAMASASSTDNSPSDTDNVPTMDEGALAIQFIKERGLYDDFQSWCEE